MTGRSGLARLAGLLYLILAVCGGWAELAVRSGIRVPGDRLALGTSAVGPQDAQRPDAPLRDWSLAVVRGSPRYDRLWEPASH